MRRREFLTLVGGAAVWPLSVRAQQTTVPMIGFLEAHSLYPLDAFADGLKETGFVEGQNVKIEYRWAEGQYDRLPRLATELVNRQVTVIVAVSFPSALAAKAATTTIPVVFVVGPDPVQLGLVDSLNRPTGNLPGITNVHGGLGAKRLELLRELVPSASVMGYLFNAKNPNSGYLSEVQTAARVLGQQILPLDGSSESEIDLAFAVLVQRGGGALLVGPETREVQMGAAVHRALVEGRR
jgi:putative ABC transport system substrate-binding protein